eukprot:11736580-Ditylum_brightwellii.AAC.1
MMNILELMLPMNCLCLQLNKGGKQQTLIGRSEMKMYRMSQSYLGLKKGEHNEGWQGQHL